jgi:hypothetical protein
MHHKSDLTHLVTMRVRNFPGYAVDVCLRILAGDVVSRSDGSRYRKIRAIAHDDREYPGWVSSTPENTHIVPRVAPLRIGLFVMNARVAFDYLSSNVVPDLKQSARHSARAETPPVDSRASEELWGHVSAVIKALPVSDPADISRVRKAVGLMFHSHATTNKVAHDVLARANALIDSLSYQRAA